GPQIGPTDPGARQEHLGPETDDRIGMGKGGAMASYLVEMGNACFLAGEDDGALLVPNPGQRLHTRRLLGEPHVSQSADPLPLHFSSPDGGRFPTARF